jgi:hypothetical protein
LPTILPESGSTEIDPLLLDLGKSIRSAKMSGLRGMSAVPSGKEKRYSAV